MGQLDLKPMYTSSPHMTPRLCVPQAMSEASDGAPSRAGSLPTLASRNGSAQLPDGSGSPPATAPGTPAGPRSSHEAGRPSHEGARVACRQCSRTSCSGRHPAAAAAPAAAAGTARAAALTAAAAWRRPRAHC